nr:MAG TPA: hypothetical protein [Caudoviricetes sp.]
MTRFTRCQLDTAPRGAIDLSHQVKTTHRKVNLPCSCCPTPPPTACPCCPYRSLTTAALSTSSCTCPASAPTTPPSGHSA